MQVGRTLGNYRLEAHIGAGGMGEVFLGEHTLIGRRAAVKVLLPEFSPRPELVRRFFNEAKAAASVQHPGIVEVYDFGQAEDGTAYLVMELLEGETLWQRIRRERRLSERLALVLGRQIASALAAAHQAGIVHRDLKPGNIFLLPSDEAPGGVRVKLMDFGVAKLIRDEPEQGLTTTGAIIGTPMYMSPEQCRGGGTSIDWRSDLYSLGCILHAMLTGKPPFMADGTGTIIAMHIYEPPPPIAAHHQVSPPVEALVRQLLAKNPDERAREIREVVGLLAQMAPTEEGRTPAPAVEPAWHPAPASFPEGTPMDQGTTVASVVPPVRRRRPVLLVAGLAVLLLGGGATAAYQAGAFSDDEEPPLPVAAPREEPVTPPAPPEPDPVPVAVEPAAVVPVEVESKPPARRRKKPRKDDSGDEPSGVTDENLLDPFAK